jgi:TerF-like vWA domain-containing protein
MGLLDRIRAAAGMTPAGTMTQRFTVAHTVTVVKDSTGAPAINLTKLGPGHLDLTKKADKAGIALSTLDLAGIRAQVVLVLDHSGSMVQDYESGAVQRLTERTLGFALQVDVDGVVPVIPFDHRRLPTVNVGVTTTHNATAYTGIVNNGIWRGRNDMGSTALHRALEVVRNMAATTDTPLYVAIITDGDPDDRAATTEIVCDLARYPVFLKFLAVRPVGYLSQLDNLGDDRRLLDNVNAQPAVGTSLNLLMCTDLEFATAMAAEWDEWFVKATAAGVLK